MAVVSGGALHVLSGGAASAATVSSSGQQVVLDDGKDSVHAFTQTRR